MGNLRLQSTELAAPNPIGVFGIDIAGGVGGIAAQLLGMGELQDTEMRHRAAQMRPQLFLHELRMLANKCLDPTVLIANFLDENPVTRRKGLPPFVIEKGYEEAIGFDVLTRTNLLRDEVNGVE